jgi:hypothetical protein
MSKKNETKPLLHRCGCGESHVKRNHKEWALIMGTEWRTKCYIESSLVELTTAYKELATYKMLILKLREDYPEIDFKAITETIADDVCNAMDDNEKASDILSMELEDRKNERD